MSSEAEEKLISLINLLVQKGIITDEELEEQDKLMEELKSKIEFG